MPFGEDAVVSATNANAESEFMRITCLSMCETAVEVEHYRALRSPRGRCMSFEETETIARRLRSKCKGLIPPVIH